MLWLILFTTQAQYNLALCYEYGSGVKKVLDKAIEFYTKASEAGNADVSDS